jgi:hypothetical protein
MANFSPADRHKELPMSQMTMTASISSVSHDSVVSGSEAMPGAGLDNRALASIVAGDRGRGHGVEAIDQLLRDRAAVLERIRGDVDLIGLARTMIFTIAAAGAVFGAAIGMYRGGVQILYGALKIPLLLLLTAAICAPGLSAFNAALDRPVSLRRDLALVLCSLALGSLLLVAQAPLVLLASSIGADYHSVILLVFACCAAAGLGSLVVLGRGVRAASSERVKSAVFALVILCSVVGAQMAWTLRPYVVRPRTEKVPFVRAIEGNLLESVSQSWRSARGYYDRDVAGMPEEVTP